MIEASEVGLGLPRYVERDFAKYLECGVLAHGFARVRCESCRDELLVAFSCKGRGVCPSCNAKRAQVTKVNRLLLNNVDVRGVGWRAYAMLRPGYMHEQWQALVPLMESGIIKPPIGATYGFEHFGRALVDMEQRRTLGKSVVRVHD